MISEVVAVLRPPVALMEPIAVATVPPLLEALWQPKIDGWRCCVFVGADSVELQGKSGALITRKFPEILPALAALPAGTVLDGEVVAVRVEDQTLDFRALSRTVVHRRELGVSVQYFAFDVLARPGRRHGEPQDVRTLPLSERWPLLLDVLDGAPQRIAPALSTTDRAQGEAWAAALVTRNFEGLVIKRTSTPYDPKRTGLWWKIRHADTVDGEVVGVDDAASTLPKLRVLLDDLEREVVTEPLTKPQARELADFLADRPPGGGPLRVEVRIGAGRHGTTKFVRARPDQ